MPDPLTAHLEAIDLPVIPHAGALPTKDRVVLSLDAEGRPVVDGERLSWRAAGDRLRRMAEPLREEGAGSPSALRVLVAADRSTRWALVEPLLHLCADPKVAAPGIVYVVRAAPSAPAGSFAAFLPEDRCCGGVHPDEVRVTIGRGRAGTADVLDVARAAAAVRAVRGRDVVVTIRIPLDAPLQLVLSVAEAAARGGAAGVGFARADSDAPSSADPATVADPSCWRFAVEPPATPGQALAPSPGDVGATLGGFPWTLHGVPEEEKPEPEPPDAIGDAPPK